MTNAQLQQGLNDLQKGLQEAIDNSTNNLRKEIRIWQATGQAEKAKQKNYSSRSPANQSLNIPNVPIPKSCDGLAAPPPAQIPANCPEPNIGASLPISHASLVPNWALPSLPYSNITAHKVRLIQYWYNEDFQLPANATNAEAVQCLDNWMRGLI